MPTKTKTTHRDDFLSLFKAYYDPLIMLCIPRPLIDFTQDIVMALMLIQLVFWSDRTKRKDGFIYKSSIEWIKEMRTTDPAVRKFKKLPYIETKVKRANGSPTTHYRINFELLNKMVIEFLEKEKLKNAEALAENSNVICEFEQTTRSIHQIHSLDSTKPLVENNETLTKITTKNTPKITTKRANAPDGALDSPLKNAFDQADQTKNLTLQVNELRQQKNADERQMMDAIAQVTHYDLNLSDLAKAARSLANQLIGEGYTPEDVHNFEIYWKKHDWRWKKDRQVPTLRNIKENISRSKEVYAPELTIEERRALALKELEDYQKRIQAEEGRSEDEGTT